MPPATLTPFTLTPGLAARFADIALGHVGREYPNKLDHVLDGPADARTPRELHPIFYGSFDWHSCVHGYWMLATLLRLFPDGEAAPRIAALFDEVFTPEKVEGELAYLQSPSSRGFERPYGWAWLLALQQALFALETDRSSRRTPRPRSQGSGGEGEAEDSLSDAEPYDLGPGIRGDGRKEGWSTAMRPLAEAFADRFKAFLPKADYPVRSGSHANTAFALHLAFGYAQAFEDDELAAAIRARAALWYGEDRTAPAWEPSGDDFLSPTLVEAQLMAAVSEPAAFKAWFEAFLPNLVERRPSTLFEPVRVSDRSDGKIAHLDGLNLSRGWAWRELAGRLEPPAAAVARAAAERHIEASLPHVAGDYMGEHWLATYAVLALTAA